MSSGVEGVIWGDEDIFERGALPQGCVICKDVTKMKEGAQRGVITDKETAPHSVL